MYLFQKWIYVTYVDRQNYTLHGFSREIISRKNDARNFSREIQCMKCEKYNSRNRRKTAKIRSKLGIVLKIFIFFLDKNENNSGENTL